MTDVQLLRQIRYKKCVRYYHQFSRPRSTCRSALRMPDASPTHTCRSAPRMPDTSPMHRRTRRLNRRNPPASTHTPDASAHQSANESVSPHHSRLPTTARPKNKRQALNSRRPILSVPAKLALLEEFISAACQAGTSAAIYCFSG